MTHQIDSHAPVDACSLAILIGTAAMIGISGGIFAPLIPLKTEAAGISSTWNGILAATPALAIILLGHRFPQIIRRLGTRPCFYLGTAVTVVAMLLFPQSSNYWAWLALRFVMGGALGLQWVVTESWINGLAAGPRRGTLLGIYIAIYSAGLALGPILLSYVGVEGFSAFVLAAAMQIACGLTLPFAQLAKRYGESGNSPVGVNSAIRIAWLENIGGFVHGARYASVFALLPLYVIHLGLDTDQSLQLL